MWFNDLKKRVWNLDIFLKEENIRDCRFKNLIIDDQSIETHLKIFMEQEEEFSLESCCKWLKKLIQNHYPNAIDGKNIIINVDLFIDGLNHLERSMKKLKKLTTLTNMKKKKKSNIVMKYTYQLNINYQHDNWFG